MKPPRPARHRSPWSADDRPTSRPTSVSWVSVTVCHRSPPAWPSGARGPAFSTSDSCSTGSCGLSANSVDDPARVLVGPGRAGKLDEDPALLVLQDHRDAGTSHRTPDRRSPACASRPSPSAARQDRRRRGDRADLRAFGTRHAVSDFRPSCSSVQPAAHRRLPGLIDIPSGSVTVAVRSGGVPSPSGILALRERQVDRQAGRHVGPGRWLEVGRRLEAQPLAAGQPGGGGVGGRREDAGSLPGVDHEVRGQRLPTLTWISKKSCSLCAYRADRRRQARAAVARPKTVMAAIGGNTQSTTRVPVTGMARDTLSTRTSSA